MHTFLQLGYTRLLFTFPYFPQRPSPLDLVREYSHPPCTGRTVISDSIPHGIPVWRQFCGMLRVHQGGN